MNINLVYKIFIFCICLDIGASNKPSDNVNYPPNAIDKILQFSDSYTKEAEESGDMDVNAIVQKSKRTNAAREALERQNKIAKLLALKEDEEKKYKQELDDREIRPIIKHEPEVKLKPRKITSRFNKPKRIAKTSLLSKDIHTISSESKVMTRIKDIVTFEGIRDNQLLGYGIVVGLNGTGDKLQNSPFTKESLIVMLERLGVNIRDLKEKVNITNVAAVMVTANLPAFARRGNRIDVNVATMGTATSLMGGTLLPTPLKGANGEVYAVSQGEVTSSGFVVTGANAKTTKGVPTNGKIVRGAIIEQEIDYELGRIEKINLSLHNPDFTTAKRIAEIINKNLCEEYNTDLIASAKDHSTVELLIPTDNVVLFLTKVEQLHITPDNCAKVVFDDKEGVIVITENVKISPVVVTHGALTVTVTHYNDYNNYKDQELQKRLMDQGRDLRTLNSMVNQKKDNQANTPGNNIFMNSKPVLNDYYNNPYNNPYYAPRNDRYQYNPFHNQISDYDHLAQLGMQTTLINKQNNTNTAIGISENGDVGESVRQYGMSKDHRDISDRDGSEDDTSTPDSARYQEYHHDQFNTMNGATLQDLLNTLNAIGASPRDMIAILQTLKRSGAIQAMLESI